MLVGINELPADTERFYPAWIREPVVEAMNQGMSTHEVERQFGIIQRTAWRWAKASGINRDTATATRIALGGPPLREDYDRISPDLTYLVGVNMGDGHAAEYVFCLGVVDEDFADTFEEAARNQFGIHIGRREPKQRNGKISYRVDIHSVDVARLMKKLSTPEWVLSLNQEYQIAWLRGAWDSEGSVTKSGENGLMVRFGVCDYAFAKLYRDILHVVLGIDRRVLGPYGKSKEFDVIFSRKSDVETFYHAVQPTILRKVRKFEEIIC